MFHSKSSSSQSFLWPSGRINQNHTLCWRRHVSNFVTSSWKHMFLLLLSSAFSKFLYLSTKCIFNHLDDVKKFRKGQPMQHASGKQRLHLRVADSAHYNLLVKSAIQHPLEFPLKQDHRRWWYHHRLWIIKVHQITGIIKFLWIIKVRTFIWNDPETIRSWKTMSIWKYY